MIHLDHVSKVYPARQGPVRSLDGVSLAIKPGEFLVVRGPSGCGKTTLLLTIGGMLRPTSGVVTVDGWDVYALGGNGRNRFRAQTIGFVFQMFHLVPYLTVTENVLMAAKRGQTGDGAARARELLIQLGLAARLTHKPEELSAGERQRTAIARALLNQPKLVLADEPTGNLDPDNSAEVFRHLAQYHHHGGTVIVVTHGNAADEFASRVIELRDGRLH